jgi:hypothetical protein
VPGPAKCARHSFYRHLQQTNSPLLSDLVLAEVIVEDSEEQDNGFKDLLELEQLVAEIVAVILLFVESPGSYAELGAFTGNQAILRRLVVVIDNQFRERPKSFIYLGPLKRLVNHDERSLVYATWLNEDSPNAMDEDSAQTMAVALSRSMPTFQKRNGDTALLSTAKGESELNEGELMCLITGLLDVFLALGLEEVEEALGLFERLSSGQKISRYLYVLRKLGLVDRVSHSNKWWYYSRRSLVDWSFQSVSQHKTTLDWRRHFRDAYERARITDSGARKRHGALGKIMQILTGNERHG